MANLNKVMLIGRLTRDPEIKTFGNGGKVANIGFAVNNRKKDKQSGEWVDVPVWIDLKVFNRETGRKMADLVESSLKKGQQVYVEGHLVLEEWTGKEDGKKASKMVVYVDDFQFLEKREGGMGRVEARRERRFDRRSSVLNRLKTTASLHGIAFAS
jgi:single-strand DNA-binding protein